MASWRFDSNGPETSEIRGPVPLISKGLAVPPESGLYIVTSSDCLSHVGISTNIRERVRKLATLSEHRGSNEVLCAAFCTDSPPEVRWEESHIDMARSRENEFKDYYGEPPSPDRYRESCRNGHTLLETLTKAAGSDSWQAGYIEAVFAIGEKLSLLLSANRFRSVWNDVGIPPGPWDLR